MIIVDKKKMLHRNVIAVENSLLQNTAMYRSVTISVIYIILFILQIIIIKFRTLYKYYAQEYIYL